MKCRNDMLNHGVNIVTAECEGVRGGLAVAWATQVATDRVLICVGSQSATRELILKSGSFGLCTLRRDQIDVARAFGRRSGRDVEKFQGFPYHTAVTGSPLLDDCGICLDCQVEHVFDQKTGNRLFVGKVVYAERLTENYEPLIYREEEY